MVFTRFFISRLRNSPLLPSIPVRWEGFVQVVYFIISTSVNKNSQHFLQVIYLILVVNSLEIGKRCIVHPSTAMCPGYCDNAKLFLSSWKFSQILQPASPGGVSPDDVVIPELHRDIYTEIRVYCWPILYHVDHTLISHAHSLTSWPPHTNIAVMEHFRYKKSAKQILIA